MKSIILKLADDSKYTFTSFTIKQRRALKGVYNEIIKMQEDVGKIQFETDEKGKLKEDHENLPIATHSYRCTI